MHLTIHPNQRFHHWHHEHAEHKQEQRILQSDDLWMAILVAGVLLLAAVLVVTLMNTQPSIIPYVPLFP